MKYFYLILSLLFFAQASRAQCPTDDITFSTQGQIDSFSILYPGCTEFDGSITIDNYQITNVIGLQGLKRIEKDLVIWHSQITSFEGFDSLNYIGQDFILGSKLVKPNSGDLYGDSIPINFQNLNNLDTIAGAFSITNHAFENFTGLSSLKKIQGIYLNECNNTVDFTGLDSLNSLSSIHLGTFLLPSPGIANTASNNSISSFVGLEQVTNLYIIKVLNAPNFSSFAGLSQLDTINTITLQSCPILEDFQGLNNLKHIGTLDIGKPDVLPGYIQFPSSCIFRPVGIKNFSGLESITSLNNLKVRSCPNLINFSGLNNLTYIQNDLTIGQLFFHGFSNYNWLNNANLSSLDGLNNVTKIGHTLSIEGKNNLSSLNGLSALDSILYDFILADNSTHTLSDLSNLKYIGHSIKLGNYFFRYTEDWEPALTDITKLSFLDTVMGDFALINLNSLTSIQGVNNIKKIQGSLTIAGNDSLNNLEAFSQLKTIAQNLKLGMIATIPSINVTLLHGNASLQNFQGLHNLTSVGKDLYIIDNQLITSLEGLNNLQTIGDSLYVGTNSFYLPTGQYYGNPQLINLNGLDNLASCNHIQIQGNPKLLGLEALNQNLTSSFAIHGNPMLSTCSFLPVCKYLDNATQPVSISNNAPGCNSANEILTNCAIYSIAGKAFYDFNQNKIQEPNEGTIPNQKIWFTPPDQIALTNQNGIFQQLCDSGTVYHLNWMDDPDWTLTTDSSSYEVLFEPGLPSNLEKDFGLYPNFTEHTGQVNLSSNPTRCNTDVNFFLRFQNTGTFMESGYTLMHYDPSCTFISSTPTTGFIVDTTAYTLLWHYDSLYPFQYQDIEITFTMPSQSSTGSTLNFLTEMYRDSLGTQSLLDAYTYTPTVLCSFDPNDKQVMPSGERDEHYTLHGEQLTYTVRFQNTGNAEAIDIRILDTIDAHLDIQSLRIVNSSFPVQTSIKGQAVEFLFKNIWLPDSISNEPESHGFVTYEIQPIADLDDYTEINNTAFIIFDFNDAIVTNTTTNTMVTMIPVALKDIEKTDITIRPNPADHQIYISARNQQNIDKILIYNTLGKLVLTQKSNSVDVSHLPKGVYVVKVEIGDKVGMEKLVIE